jgi:type III secretion protein U
MSVSKSRFLKAIGLSYDPDSGEAPTVSTSAEIWDADEVVRIAKRYGIPVVENEELAHALVALDRGEQIPEDLFEAAAIILASMQK